MNVSPFFFSYLSYLSLNGYLVGCVNWGPTRTLSVRAGCESRVNVYDWRKHSHVKNPRSSDLRAWQSPGQAQRNGKAFSGPSRNIGSMYRNYQLQLLSGWLKPEAASPTEASYADDLTCLQFHAKYHSRLHELPGCCRLASLRAHGLLDLSFSIGVSIISSLSVAPVRSVPWAL